MSCLIEKTKINEKEVEDGTFFSKNCMFKTYLGGLNDLRISRTYLALMVGFIGLGSGRPKVGPQREEAT